MKNTFVFMILLIVFLSCEKEIHITQPTILVKNESPKVLDTIKIQVIENAEIEGDRIFPNYFNWSILDENNLEIFSDFKDSSTIDWIPDSAGYYIIRVKIGYENNKSITTLKEIIINESIVSLQKKLIGKWTGNAEAVFGLKWKIDLTFDNFEHYIGKASNLSNTAYGFIGPFYYGHYSVDNPEGGQMLIEMSEDIPCTRFLINEIINNKGYGILSIGFEYEYGGNPYEYGCSELFYIEELEFTNNYKALFFSVNLISGQFSDWYIQFNLTKNE